jgi:hypothetical protein
MCHLTTAPAGLLPETQLPDSERLCLLFLAGGGNGGSIAAGPIKPSGTEPYSHFGDLGVISSQQLVGFDSALLQLGNVMEASLRSCSGLIERFHHSLFLYVLTGLDNYVSVERYIGPLVAFICVLVLQVSFLQWCVCVRVWGGLAALFCVWLCFSVCYCCRLVSRGYIYGEICRV